MTVEIYITDSPGTLAVDCRDIITSDDLRYVLERCLAAVRARPQHFLIDCSNFGTLAPGALHALASYADFLQHPNTQWLAFVTDNMFLKNTIHLLFDCEALRVFEDRETATRFLHGFD